MGPVIDRSAQEKILEYVALARQERRVAFSGQVPDGHGYYVPLRLPRTCLPTIGWLRKRSSDRSCP